MTTKEPSEPTPGSVRHRGRVAILGLEFASRGNALAAELLIGQKLHDLNANAIEGWAVAAGLAKRCGMGATERLALEQIAKLEEIP